MTDEHAVDRAALWRLVRAGAIALVVAAVADVALEWQRAQTALGSWICDKGLPLPAGPDVCSAAYVLHWFLARLPFYVGIVALALLLVRGGTVAYGMLRAGAGGATARTDLLRLVLLAIALLALAELVSCAGETTCSLSVSCT